MGELLQIIREFAAKILENADDPDKFIGIFEKGGDIYVTTSDRNPSGNSIEVTTFREVVTLALRKGYTTRLIEQLAKQNKMRPSDVFFVQIALEQGDCDELLRLFFKRSVYLETVFIKILVALTKKNIKFLF